MSQLIDRRLNGKHKSAVNRQRFIERYKNHIKHAVAESIAGRSITEIDKGEKVSIPAKDLSEPRIVHGKGGRVEHVLPGNKEYVKGDSIPKPQSENENQGEGGSPEGEGQDDFVFELSRDEFLDLYFEDLALPDMVKKQLATISEIQYQRAGVTTSGNPSNINVLRSMRQAVGRRVSLRAASQNKIEPLEDELEALRNNPVENADAIKEIEEKISALKHRIEKIPFIDTIDLRYNNRVEVKKPSTNAVMFCIMDVSGSMDEAKKDIAKRFFILLYLFLNRLYKKIDLVFIRHHTSAKVVDEQEFFYSRETGGTVVSSALEEMKKTIQEKYAPQAWNIYAAQASDGDNWNADSPHCQELLANHILPLVQYYAYIEIMPRHHQSLWEAYALLKKQFPQFAMQNIDTASDIFHVFRELFKRQTA